MRERVREASVFVREICGKTIVVKHKEVECRGRVIVVETVTESQVLVEYLCDSCGQPARKMRRLKRTKNSSTRLSLH